MGERIELSLHTSSVATALGDTNGMYITEQTCCLFCHVLAEAVAKLLHVRQAVDVYSRAGCQHTAIVTCAAMRESSQPVWILLSTNSGACSSSTSWLSAKKHMSKLQTACEPHDDMMLQMAAA